MEDSPAQIHLPVPDATLPHPSDASQFVSGTTHKLFRLSQRLSAADLADDMESDDGPICIGRKFGGTHTAARRGALSGSGGPGAGTGVRGGASLWDLVEAGVIVPGRGKITVTYKGVTVSATLTDDGCIEYQGRKYQSATAFSIHFKRTITPSKQGDDGWKSVLYDGKALEHYRHVHSIHLRQRALAAAQASEAQGEGAATEAPTAPPQQAALAERPVPAAPQQAADGAPGPSQQHSADAPATAEQPASEAPASGKRPAPAAKSTPAPVEPRSGTKPASTTKKLPSSTKPTPAGGRSVGRVKPAATASPEEAAPKSVPPPSTKGGKRRRRGDAS